MSENFNSTNFSQKRWTNPTTNLAPAKVVTKCTGKGALGTMLSKAPIEEW